MDCKIRSFNAYRAEKFGCKLSIIDRLIMARSKLHTHTEFQFSERYLNISFSATMADGCECCRFKQIDYSEHIDRWDTIIVPLTDEQETAIMLLATKLEGTPYDLTGLLSFINEHTTIIHPSKEGYWCTECVLTLVLTAHPTLPLIPDQSHPTMADSIARWYFGDKEAVAGKECK